ncbi:MULTISPECIES: ABC transporter ATP-binding protein [Photobacterium]|uniref:ABC transporter ATP-binding protein n=1 Tax=Photobacterium TaxID=657 RepID=UPI001C2DD66C|nr:MULTISPECIES: ABC transporter ATP-binding protein [Photobacterium]MBV1839064.1 ABC transporter ATP-binding protein [Photobacterium ganghwense]
METLIKAKQLSKSYGRFKALMDVSFELKAGQVMGLLGHNGAGKSSLIKSLLGAHDFDGELSVFGLSPRKDRVNIVRDLAYISDVAMLPEWMTVKQVINYVSGVHPKFSKDAVHEFLKKTNIQLSTRISRLSKGMKVQLHLGLVMSSQAKVLILDEPTLGLDLMFRETFYQHLMQWFEQGDRALIIASHEVDEIAHLLTDVLILKRGKPVFMGTIADAVTQLTKVQLLPEQYHAAEVARPVWIQHGANSRVGYYRNQPPEKLARLGELSIPTLAEVFLALQQEEQ